MSFDIVEVLNRAFQITWKNKVLWLFGALPSAVSFLIFPIVLMPMILSGTDSRGNPQVFENPAFIAVFVLGTIIISLLSFVLYIAGFSALTLGIYRAANGEAALPLRELLREAMKYLGRIIGLMLIFTVAFSAVFTTILFILMLFGLVTMGMGFICMQPLMLLLTPVIWTAQALIEQAQAAVVADDLGVRDALYKSWTLIKSNFWRILLISLIIYFGISTLTSLIIVPVMFPFFFVPFLFGSSGFENTMVLVGLVIAAFGAIFLSGMALVQGITITFMKSTYLLVYLRLTRSPNVPIAVDANM